MDYGKTLLQGCNRLDADYVKKNKGLQDMQPFNLKGKFIMKNKKILAVLMAVTMVMVGGCGNQTETNNDTKGVIAETNTEIAEADDTETTEKDVAAEVSTDVNTTQEFSPAITEKDDSELHLKNYHDYLEDKTLCTDEDVFSNGAFESVEDVYFQTTKKVPMYASNGVRTGYIDEDVGFSVIATCGDWCYFYIGMDNAKRYARLSEIEENSMTLEEIDAMRAEAEVQAKVDAEAEKQQTQTKPVEDTSLQNTPPATEPVEIPVESNKYTPEEAISIYRSIMEGGGITWDPSLKGVSSWGTGFFYLDKGYPEWAGESSLESFAMGDSVGNPWTRYYLEVTDSDDECVYFTSWNN